MLNIEEEISAELGIETWQVNAVVSLIDEGNTIPFIARYRKEKHGGLDDEQLRNLNDRLSYLRGLEARKLQVISAISQQDKLTAELENKISSAKTLVEVEDLYRPYKPKRRTRAMIAREKGLLPLAQMIMEQKLEGPALTEAASYISAENGVENAQEALDGASDIIAEEISDNAAYRTWIRRKFQNEAVIVSEAKDKDAKSVYEMYYDFSEKVSDIAGHRVLALNRGEKEKVLTVAVNGPDESVLQWIKSQMTGGHNEYASPVIEAAAEDSYKRLIQPAVEREIRNMLTESAEEGAMEVFSKNLKQLLMQPPITGRTVLGWDPAFRTGCKLAVVDATGKVLDTVVIFPTAPQNKVEQSKAILKKLIKKYNITLISLGNGTASRESENVIADLIREIPEKISYVIVSEAGASVYSASELATKEFPEFDVGQRSAASIARRLQDPLAELVKIDPKAIGVGQYQHDMNQKRLTQVLSETVEDCVNSVGVDLNTASVSLLEYVSGITPVIARNIVSYREENGSFDNRKQLLKVSKLGPKAFENCAGFLRIRGGSQPLDNTGIHPESYGAASALLAKAGLTSDRLGSGPVSLKLNNEPKTAGDLGVGVPTLRDIVKEMARPGRDPRENMPKPVLRTDVLDMKDLKPGMILKGTVRNVIDFGAFVDIGVHQDGLVHISQLTNKRYIRHALDFVSVGDVVDVKVLSVDPGRGRIQLSMILD